MSRHVLEPIHAFTRADAAPWAESTCALEHQDMLTQLTCTSGNGGGAQIRISDHSRLLYSLYLLYRFYLLTTYTSFSITSCTTVESNLIYHISSINMTYHICAAVIRASPTPDLICCSTTHHPPPTTTTTWSRGCGSKALLQIGALASSLQMSKFSRGLAWRSSARTDDVNGKSSPPRGDTSLRAQTHCQSQYHSVPPALDLVLSQNHSSKHASNHASKQASMHACTHMFLSICTSMYPEIVRECAYLSIYPSPKMKVYFCIPTPM